WITNAIDCGTPEVVAWMLDHGAPVIFPDEGRGRRDAEGYTVLHSALERRAPGKYEIMRLLIEAGADVNEHGANDWTPAHLAAVSNDVEALKFSRMPTRISASERESTVTNPRRRKPGPTDRLRLYAILRKSSGRKNRRRASEAPPSLGRWRVDH